VARGGLPARQLVGNDFNSGGGKAPLKEFFPLRGCPRRPRPLQWGLEGWICQDWHDTTYLFETALRYGRVGMLGWIRAVCPGKRADERGWLEACQAEQLPSMTWLRREFPECPAPRSVWRRAQDLQLCGGRMIEWLRANFEDCPI
jgi:hypothetical protein